MRRRTVSLPEELDDQVLARLDHGDSYSAEVQAALRQYLDAGEVDS